MKKHLVILIAALGSANLAQAGLISGFGDPSLNPALVGGTQEGFESTASGLYSSLTFGNFTLTSLEANNPFTVGSDFAGGYNNFGNKSVYNDFDLAPSGFRFSFANPVDAFAFNWGAADNTWTLKTYDSSNNLIETLQILGTFASNAGEYFGASGSGIAYALLTDNKNNIPDGDYVFIDRVTYSGAKNVADTGSTLGLLTLAIAGLVGLRRKFSRS